MSKGQKRSNREVKKPKAVKAKEPVTSSFTTSPGKSKGGAGSEKKKTP